MNHKKLFVIIMLLAALLATAIGAAAQDGSDPNNPQAVSTSFTYQGYLTDSAGVPIHESCDMRFDLYDAAEGGNPIGNDDQTNIQVDHGYFTVNLDFGSQAFSGSERYLAIEVWCGDAPSVLLTPRQRLSAAPYALYALNTPDHSHFGEVFQGVSTFGLFVDNSLSPAGVGLLVQGPGNDAGRAISAVGGVYSTADSILNLSPQSMVVRDGSSSTSVQATGGGAALISLPADTNIKHILLPVNTFGQLFGSQMYVKSIQVCYHTDNNGSDNYIGVTRVYKNGGVSTGSEVLLVDDNTDRSSDTYACYTVNAPTPRLPIDNTLWVQFYLKNMTAMASTIYISTVELTLTEKEE